MFDHNRFPDVVLWQEGCLPVSSSAMDYDGPFPKTELHLDHRFDYDDDRVLRGRSIHGECLTVHKSIGYCAGHQYMVHNYDKANNKPIEDESQIDDFELFTTSIVLVDGFIGDRYIDEANPPIDRLVFESCDLRILHRAYSSLCDEEPNVLMFENDFVSIEYSRGFSQSLNDQREEKKYTYAVVFDFKQPVALSEAMHKWMNPIIGLLMVVLGGDIVPDDLVFFSKGYGAEFRKFAPFTERRIGYEPRIESFVFLGRDLAGAMPLVISSWMERPNTLCGVSPLYPHARYRLSLSESKFSFAMRLAEAAYADAIVEGICNSEEIPLNSSGEYDLDEAIYKPVKRELKRLADGRTHPFVKKIKTLGERFDCEYRAFGKRIDWRGCANACKNYRNAEAHGTIVNGQPEIEHDKLFALEQMGLLFYELAVLDLFIAHNASLADLRTKVFETRLMNVSIADFWPLRS